MPAPGPALEELGVVPLEHHVGCEQQLDVTEAQHPFQLRRRVYNVLPGIASAPILVIAANAITQSFPMGMCMPTRLALPTPVAGKRFASCRECRSRSANVVVASSVITNGRSPNNSAARLQHHRHRRVDIRARGISRGNW